MNNARRKRINDVVDRLTTLQEEIDGLAQEEQEYRDNMPENMQDSEKAERADDVVTSLDLASQTIDEVIESLNEAAE